MKPQIIDRYVYVKGKKISEVDNKTVLDGTEKVPLAQNDMNYSTTVDTISNYVDSVHDYLTTEDYNDLKSQIDSERTNRQEADNELNQSIQDAKSELHSTISNVESELLNEVNDLQGQIDNINDTGIANGVTLDTVQTITGKKTFTTVPKSTASATSANDLTNKNYVDTAISEALGDTISDVVTTNTAQEISGLKTFKTLPKGDGTPTADNDLVTKQYVDNTVANVDVDLDGYATQAWVNEQGFAKTSDIPEGLEIGETTGTAFDGGRGKAVEDTLDALNTDLGLMVMHGAQWSQEQGDLQLNLDQAYRDGVSKDFTDRYIPIIVPTATSEHAGAMSASDKKKLDSLSNSSDVYVIDYITEESGTVTQEQYNELRSAIEENKVIIFTVDTLQYVVTCSFLKDSSLKLYFSLNDITQRSNALQVNAVILRINSNGEYYTESPHINLYSNGDGTKYLSDDGTYKTITQLDPSNYVDNDIFNESITQLGSTITNEVTTLEKKDAELQSSIETINESITQLDDKYLPLSGGTLTGNLTVQDGIDVINGLTCGTSTYGSETNTTKVTISNVASPSINDYYLRLSQTQLLEKEYGVIANTDLVNSPRIDWQGLAIALNGEDRDVYFVSANAGIDIRNSCNIHKIYHEGNVARSKVTTNSMAGGLNITKITQSAYDGLDSKDANTLYIITE